MELLRIVAAGILILLCGFAGLSFLFSELGPGETRTQRVVLGALWFLGSGIVVGALLGRWWWGAALIAWGGFLLGPAYLWMGKLRLFAICLPGPAILALVGGYLGSTVVHLIVRDGRAGHPLPR